MSLTLALSLGAPVPCPMGGQGAGERRTNSTRLCLKAGRRSPDEKAPAGGNA